MKHFADLGLAEPILRAVAAEGYTTPTPIQTEVIPAMKSGRDIIGIAQTGTGKTAAFVLPLLDAFAGERRRPEPKGCRALVLVPTRELASQIADSIRAYGRHTQPTVAVIVGGVKPGPQIRALAAGVDFVIATPGRLEDHMRSGAVRLERTGVVVLDEADQMLDLGFMPAIRRILGKVPAARQTVLLSATMPQQIRSLAQDFLTSPAEIAVAPSARPIELIAQSVMLVAAAGKRDALVELLAPREVERALVFTRTKRGADRVCEHLDKAGLSTIAIHGNKSQSQRERALDAFRAGRVRILVATDIAARGIDVDGISHIVNFELPDVPEAYVHRIGRTARAGNSGIAVSLCDPAERGLLRDIERLIGRRLTSADGRELPAATEFATGLRTGRAGAGADAARGRGPRSRSGARDGERTSAAARHPRHERTGGAGGARPSSRAPSGRGRARGHRSTAA